MPAPVRSSLRMRGLLTRPYPLHPDALHHVGRALLFGVFVAAFLGVFPPFGLQGAAHLGLLAGAFGPPARR